MTQLTFTNLADDWIGPITLRLDAGLHVLTGARPALARLVELACGAQRARRGVVSLGDRSVHEARVRQRVGALLADEELIPARTVRDALASAIALRRSALDAMSVLKRSGLESLAERRPTTLDSLERRAVMLALVLADTSAEALVLYDPLAVSPLVRRDFVLESCLQLGRSAPILIATPQLEDGLVFGGQLLVFARGAIFSAPAQRATTGVSLAVRSKEARRLAGLLAGEPGVVGVVFDAERAPFQVLVRAIDPEALADTVTRVACNHDVPIASLTTSFSMLGVTPPQTLATPPMLSGPPVGAAVPAGARA